MAKRFRRTRKGRVSAPEPPQPLRLHPDQLHGVAKVKALRSEARDLRTQVSAGAHGDAERERLYQLAKNAGGTLQVSKHELAQRAGLGDNFFLTLIRDRRYPKLENFL